MTLNTNLGGAEHPVPTTGRESSGSWEWKGIFQDHAGRVRWFLQSRIRGGGRRGNDRILKYAQYMPTVYIQLDHVITVVFVCIAHGTLAACISPLVPALRCTLPVPPGIWARVAECGFLYHMSHCSHSNQTTETTSTGWYLSKQHIHFFTTGTCCQNKGLNLHSRNLAKSKSAGVNRQKVNVACPFQAFTVSCFYFII